MRPFSPDLKTAFVFYLVFTILVIWVEVAAPSQPVTPVFASGLPEKSGLVMPDPVTLSEDFYTRWLNLLREKNLLSSVKQSRDVRLTEKKVGTQVISWARSSEVVIVSPDETEDTLCRFGSLWFELAQELGVTPTSPKWGYTRQYLWLKLSASSRHSFSDSGSLLTLTLPTENWTFFQPLTRNSCPQPRWSGLLPAPVPELTPVPEAVFPLWIRDLAPSPLPLSTPAPSPVLTRKPRIALIVDDVGYLLDEAMELLKVDAPLTWAVLPETPHALECIVAARRRGFEIILHLPLEPLEPNIDPGPGLIRREWLESEIYAQLESNLKVVPGAVGVNNHMGSAGTQDERLMGYIMKLLAQKGLFYVDSGTASGTASEKCARIYRVPFARRHVFIDNDPNPEVKKSALRQLVRIARKQGEAIGILHVRKGNAAVLREILPEFVRNGIEIVPVSLLVQR